VLKVTNILSPIQSNTYQINEWDELEGELFEEFCKFGEIAHFFLVRPYQATIGAEASTLFVEYKDS